MSHYYLGCIALVLSAACGCSADAGGNESEAWSEEEDRIRTYLTIKGYDPARLRFSDEEIRVDEDSYYIRSELLAELEQYASNADAPKGYYHERDPRSGGPSYIPRGNITLQFESNVPEWWRESFRMAGYLYSNVSYSDCLNILEGSSENSLRISMGDAGTADDGTPAAASASLPYTPIYGGFIRVGSRVIVDTDHVDNADYFWRLAVALHEMGHTLGFKHPWQANWIAGTAKNTGSGVVASYETIMDYNITLYELLSADDRSSVNKAFDKRLTPSCGSPRAPTLCLTCP